MKIKSFIKNQCKNFIVYFAEGKYNQDVLLEQIIFFHCSFFALFLNCHDVLLIKTIVWSFAKSYLIVSGVIILFGFISRKFLLKLLSK